MTNGAKSAENTYLSHIPVYYQDSRSRPEFDALSHTLMNDTARLLSFTLNLSRIIQHPVDGSFAELGVWEGHSAKVLHYFSRQDQRRLYLFDTFQGLDKRDLVGIDKDIPSGNFPTSVDKVKAYLGKDQLENTRFCVGYFPDTITEECRDDRFAFVHIDCDLHKPICDALEFFYPRMNSGGMIFIHDYHNPQFRGSQKAVEEFCLANKIVPILLPDVATTSVITKDDR